MPDRPRLLPFPAAFVACTLLASACTPQPPASAGTPVAAAPAVDAAAATAGGRDAPAPVVATVVAEPGPLVDDVPPLRPGVADALRSIQSAACLAHSQPQRTATPPMHRWVDAAGIVHYSDRPPPVDARAHKVIALAAEPTVQVQASGADVELPAELQQRAAADALGIQRVLHDALGVARPAGMKLKIVFVRSPATYARLVGEPSLAQSSGAYTPANRTIHVRTQGDDEFDLSVLRHEIAHALVHEAIGNLPVSINEGLAEYFGRYRSVGMGGQVDVGAGRAQVMRAAPADAGEAIVDLLAREGTGFYADARGRDRRYQQAFALVAVLMRDAAGRSALRAVLDAQAASPCVPVAAETVLEANFPGGLARLAQDWISFMRDPPAEVRSY